MQFVEALKIGGHELFLWREGDLFYLTTPLPKGARPEVGRCVFRSRCAAVAEIRKMIQLERMGVPVFEPQTRRKTQRKNGA